MEFYIASSLDNAPAVKEMADYLKSYGLVQSYDWTLHGAVYNTLFTEDANTHNMSVTAELERQGVINADVLIVMLPGGRGTHIEMGIALALGRPILLIGKEEGPHHCAFYAHHSVRRMASATAEQVRSALEKDL